MFTINTKKILKPSKVQVSLRDEEDKFTKSNIHLLTVLPCWLAGPTQIEGWWIEPWCLIE